MAIAHPDLGNSRLPGQGLEPRPRQDRPLPGLKNAGPPCGRKRLLLGTTLPTLALIVALAGLPTVAYAQSSTLPGEFAFRTKKGYYLTAISGGGRFRRPDDHHRSDFGRAVGEIQDRRGRPGSDRVRQEL